MGSGCVAVIGMGDSRLWYWCGSVREGPWVAGGALLPLECVLWGQNTLVATLLGCWGAAGSGCFSAGSQECPL